jgi:hypothetical protein
VSHYYYFAASLPSLAFGQKAPISSGEFLIRAGRQLPPADFHALSSVSLGGPGDEARIPGSLYRDYLEFETSLREELLLLRARRLGRKAEAYLPTRDGKADAGANDGRGASCGGESPKEAARRVSALAFGAGNPLEGELVLERERWAFIDGRLPFQTFDLDSLVAYRIKLLIIERMASFSPERGEGEYRRLYDGILSAWTADAGSNKNQDRSSS